MRTRNNIATLDTETVGTFGSPIIHDFGYMINDKELGTPLVAKRYLTEELHKVNDYMLRTSDFYKSKKSLYDEAKANNEVEIKPWKEIIAEFIADCKKYNVKVISAYNLAFDYRAINATNAFFNNGDTKVMEYINKKAFLCIWDLACETVLDTDDYRKYATMKDLISEKGNYLTNAESCYRYLFKDNDFEEEHTALADVEIEVQILKYIIENCHHKVKYGLAYNSWKKVQG